MRGAGDLPYNPRRPLRLPGDKPPKRRPQLNTEVFIRLGIPVAALIVLGIGVFFAVDALIGGGDNDAGNSDTGNAAVADQPSTGGSSTDTPADATADTPTVGGADTTDNPSQTTDTPATDDQSETPIVTEPAPTIITAADLDGAPVLVERGGATPIPSGLPDRTLADGSPYDPTDETIAFSSLWSAGTVLEITRLPGGPLLSEEDVAVLIGKTIRVTVAATDSFRTELQLSPAAYQLLALDVEPIIALRMEVVEAPPR